MSETSNTSNSSGNDLTIDEPIATGPVRVSLHGDRKTAEGYMLPARAQLARLKTNHGVNARVAAGEPGGFFRSTKVMPDGTRIEAFTNDGLDSVRITVPETPQATSTTFVGEGEHTAYEPTPVDFEYEPDWPGKDKPGEEPPSLNFTPYLWIGVRIVKGGDPPEYHPDRRPQKWAQRLHVCVWEPAPPDRPQVILSNRNQFESLVPEVLMELRSKEVYPLHYWDQHIPSDFEEDPELPRDEPLPTAIAYTDDKLVMILPHNVYDIPMRVPRYDPAKDEDVEWDVIFVSDPDNDLKLFDTANPNNKMEGGYDGGEYLVKVMAVAADCQHYEPCEVEIKIFIGKDGEEIVDKQRFTIEHYTNYRMGIMPKGWFAPTQDYPDHSCLQCYYRAQDSGPNPHGPHWWQGMAVAGVPHMQVAVPEADFLPPYISFSRPGEVEIPKTGFEPAAFHSRAAICPGCHTVSVRFYSFSLGERGMSHFLDPNYACTIHYQPVVLHPAEERSYAISQRQGELGGTMYLSNSDVPSPGAFGWHFRSHGIASYQWETEGGHSGSGPVQYVDEVPDVVTATQEYRWLAFYEYGAVCITGVFFPGPPAPDYLWYSSDVESWEAHVNQKLGGVPHNDEAHVCYRITTEQTVDGQILRDELDFISRGEWLAAPPLWNNASARGTDTCATVEDWEWSTIDWDNMPPNYRL